VPGISNFGRRKKKEEIFFETRNGGTTGKESHEKEEGGENNSRFPKARPSSRKREKKGISTYKSWLTQAMGKNNNSLKATSSERNH